MQTLKRKLAARKVFVPWGQTRPLPVQRPLIHFESLEPEPDQQVCASDPLGRSQSIGH